MKKRSVALKGHQTSITLEDEFWTLLRHIAHTRQLSLAALINQIDEKRLDHQGGGGLSSAIRVYILQWVLQNNLPIEPSDQTIHE